MDDVRKQLFYEQKNGYDLISRDDHLASEDYCRGYMAALSGQPGQGDDAGCHRQKEP